MAASSGDNADLPVAVYGQPRVLQEHPDGDIAQLLAVIPVGVIGHPQQFECAGGTSLGIVDSLFSTAEKAYKVAQKLRDAELQYLVTDLRPQLADLKGQVAEPGSENSELRRHDEHLGQTADVRSKVEFRDGGYYLSERIQGCSQGPLCSTCLDGDGVLVKLKRTFTVNVRSGEHRPTGWRRGRCGSKCIE